MPRACQSPALSHLLPFAHLALLARPPATTHHPTVACLQEDADLERERRHFSYFAFEGGTGATRWMHEVSAFGGQRRMWEARMHRGRGC